MTPAELAAELGVAPKTLRDWLRREHPRPSTAHRERWSIDDAMADAARGHFSGGGDRASTQRSSERDARNADGRRRSDRRDESYVVDLVDEVLGETGVRQHRFDWLLGDPNSEGRRVRLPVDAWYPGARLVLEYRELQHSQPVPIMDHRMTVSGVDRGEQRRRYDRLRDELIPAHGLRLVVIRPHDLDADRRGRLRRRNRQDNLAAVRRIIGASDR